MTLILYGQNNVVLAILKNQLYILTKWTNHIYIIKWHILK